MRFIGVTNSAISAVVDDEDYERVSKYNWSLGGRTVKYARCTMNGKTVYLHNFVLGIQASYRGLQTDHRDGDPLNCQKDNLRRTTRGINNQNTGKYEKASGGKMSSRYTGVSWHKRKQQWHAYITRNGVRQFLGYFSSEIAAARAYNSAAYNFYGPDAKTNVIESVN